MPQEGPSPPSEPFAEEAVHFATDRPTAETAASLLRAEGIPVRLDTGVEAAGHIPWGRSQYTIFVPASRADEARELLGVRPARQIELTTTVVYAVIGLGFVGLAAALLYLVGVYVGAL